MNVIKMDSCTRSPPYDMLMALIPDLRENGQVATLHVSNQFTCCIYAGEPPAIPGCKCGRAARDPGMF